MDLISELRDTLNKQIHIYVLSKLKSIKNLNDVTYFNKTLEHKPYMVCEFSTGYNVELTTKDYLNMFTDVKIKERKATMAVLKLNNVSPEALTVNTLSFNPDLLKLYYNGEKIYENTIA